MALFPGLSNGKTVQPPRKRVEARGLSIVARDLTISGDLATDGVVKVEGRVCGSVQAGGQVVVSPGAVIEGDVVTQEAIVGGEVRGGIVASERVELHASSVVHGNIHSPRLLIQEGARVNGEVRMGEAAGRAATAGRTGTAGTAGTAGTTGKV